VVPNSQSAKEISDLWLYIQEKLSRIVRDPALLPDLKPEHLAVKSLMAETEAPAEIVIPAAEIIPVTTPLTTDVTIVPESAERRAGLERRVLLEARAHERRVFGRRASDHAVWGVK
jgi:hypothetical protein